MSVLPVLPTYVSYASVDEMLNVLRPHMTAEPSDLFRAYVSLQDWGNDIALAQSISTSEEDWCAREQLSTDFYVFGDDLEKLYQRYKGRFWLVKCPAHLWPDVRRGLCGRNQFVETVHVCEDSRVQSIRVV